MVESAGTSPKLEDTLAERKTQHGNFVMHAQIEFELRAVLDKYGSGLPPYQKMALSMVFHKAARILNRGNMHSDSWHDIAGYARLAEKEILSE